MSDQTRRIVIVLCIFAISIAAFLFAFRKTFLPPVSSDGIPVPFGMTTSSLRATLTQIGVKSGVPIVNVTFEPGQTSERLPTGEMLFLLTDADLAAAHAPLSAVLTSGKRIYGYKYTSKAATIERQQREEADAGAPKTYAEIFPGQFFASDAERANGTFIADFERSNHITFNALSDVTLEPDARYVFIVEDEDVRVTIAGVAWCGNGKVESSEECDDGNTSACDGCSRICKAEPLYMCTRDEGQVSTCMTSRVADFNPGISLDGNNQYSAINFNPARSAMSPSFTVFGGKLYAAWSESNDNGSQVRVAVYNGDDAAPHWTNVDGGARMGIIRITSQVVYATNVQMVASGDRLYLQWDEGSSQQTSRTHVAVYGGNDADPRWRFLTPMTGLALSTGNASGGGRAAIFNNKLYVAWAETAGDFGMTNRLPWMQYIAVLGGDEANPVWRTVMSRSIPVEKAGGSPAPRLIVHRGALYAISTEGRLMLPEYNTSPQVRVAVFNSQDLSPAWTDVGDGSVQRIADSLPPSLMAFPAVHNGKLYVGWTDGSSILNVAVYNDDPVHPVWTRVGGDYAAGSGIARYRVSLMWPEMLDFGGHLYITWGELNGTLRVRAAVYGGDDAVPRWTAIDDGGNKGLGTDSSDQGPVLVGFDGRLYAGWWDRNHTLEGQLRLKREACPDCPAQSGQCNGGLPIPVATCGNGIREVPEACDDGTPTSGDGCDAMCNVETGYRCTGDYGQRSVCDVDTGNGGDLVDTTECIRVSVRSWISRRYPQVEGTPWRPPLADYVVFGGHSYVMVYENLRQLRVGELKCLGNGWQLSYVDGGANGLTQGSETSPFEAKFAPAGSTLFAAWNEFSPAPWVMHVAAFNGDSAAPAWTLVDGTGLSGLNKQASYVSYCSAENPAYTDLCQMECSTPGSCVQPSTDMRVVGAASIGDKLFITAFEDTVCKYDGASSSDTCGNGLLANTVGSDASVVPCADSAFGCTPLQVDSKVRVLEFNGDVGAPEWRLIDPRDALYRRPMQGGTMENIRGIRGGLNLGVVIHEPSIQAIVGQLFVTWGEEDGAHLAVYNGNDASPAWDVH